MSLYREDLSPKDAAAFEQASARWRTAPTSCADKRRYASWHEAQIVVIAYNFRVPLVFGKFSAYLCRRHASWHTGHLGGRAAASRCLQRGTAGS